MPVIEAQLNDVEAWGGENVQLPPGEYQLKVKGADVEQKDANEQGVVKSSLVVEYEVLSGAFSGKTVKAWFGLDFTKEVMRKRLKSLVNASGINTGPTGAFDSNQLVGCKINADVTHDTFQSDKRDPITGNILPPKTFVRVVNERPFREVVAGPTAQTNAGGTKQPASVGGSLPGLTRA